MFNYEFEPSKATDAQPDEYSVSIEIRDGYGKLIGYLGDWEEGTQFVFSAEASDTESSQIVVNGSSPWTKYLMRANINVTLVHMLLYRQNNLIKIWTGRIDRSVRSIENGQGSVTVELVSDKAWLKYIMAYSAPFSTINIQFPRTNIKIGPAIHEMKQFLSDNLLRIQNRKSSLLTLVPASTWQEDSSRWANMGNLFPYLAVVPTAKSEDKTPRLALTAQMTPMDEIWSQACKDYNLLPTVTMHIPGRDPSPKRIAVNGPTVVFDIIDKDIDRSRNGSPTGGLGGVLSSIIIFFRGLFGRYDTPPQNYVQTSADLMKFFGNYTTDKWVVFRMSDEHWNRVEVASYAPTATASIAGGKSQEFLNKGVNLIFNFLIKFVLSKLSLGLISGDIVGGFFDDVLFAYQRAEDEQMQALLGPFAFPEEYTGKGSTAWSMDATQALRSARFAAVGYRTASFTGDAASFPPFRPFEEFDLLDPVGWEDPEEDKIQTERVKQISVNLGETGVSFETRLGEIDRPEEPWAIQMRRNEAFKRALDLALNLD